MLLIQGTLAARHFGLAGESPGGRGCHLGLPGGPQALGHLAALERNDAAQQLTIQHAVGALVQKLRGRRRRDERVAVARQPLVAHLLDEEVPGEARGVLIYTPRPKISTAYPDEVLSFSPYLYIAALLLCFAICG